MIDILICEDDILERGLIKEMLAESGYRNVREASSSDELFRYFERHHPDLILLDINMPGINGLEAAARLRKSDREIAIIFVTAHADYALNAFQVFASDYLVKPILKSRLINSIERIKRVQQREERAIRLTSRHAAFNIKENDILFIERSRHKVYVYTAMQTHETVMSLQELEKLLSAAFCRTHSGFIINKNKLTKIVPRGNMSYELFFGDFPKTALLSRGKRRCLMAD